MPLNKVFSRSRLKPYYQSSITAVKVATLVSLTNISRESFSQRVLCWTTRLTRHQNLGITGSWVARPNVLGCDPDGLLENRFRAFGPK